MINRIRELGKRIAFRHTSLGAPKYSYQLEPLQLMEIIAGIERSVCGKSCGCIVEVGVARGMTTRFICEHLKCQRYNLDYYCLDTFSSFTKKDIQYEVEIRGKRLDQLDGFFSYNDLESWQRNFIEFQFLRPVQCDASEFDFSTIEPIHFCLLDVDLYLPTKNVLMNILPYMSENGIIVVDDVQDNNRWDGAYQAFVEFVEEKGVAHHYVGNKCGVITI